MDNEELIQRMAENYIVFTKQILNLTAKINELIESNDRLTKALIDSYSESEPDYDIDIPQPVYMDGSEVK